MIGNHENGLSKTAFFQPCKAQFMLNFPGCFVEIEIKLSFIAKRSIVRRKIRGICQTWIIDLETNHKSPMIFVVSEIRKIQGEKHCEVSVCLPSWIED